MTKDILKKIAYVFEVSRHLDAKESPYFFVYYITNADGW